MQTNMAAAQLFRDTNMAAVSSRENTFFFFEDGAYKFNGIFARYMKTISQQVLLKSIKNKTGDNCTFFRDN